MRARQKLNASYFNGSLLIAGLTGGLTQSWVVFFTVLFISLGVNLYLVEIRPPKQDRRNRDVR
jgi:hypothetical protein